MTYSKFLKQDKWHWYRIRGTRFYYKSLKDSGMTLSEIGKIFCVLPESVRQQILKCNSYKSKPYKETRDVYADFKKHYDEVMG